MDFKAVRKVIDLCINEIGPLILTTPTGDMRNQLCDANIHLHEAARNLLAVECGKVLEKEIVPEIN
jgi:hypothetical protein